ncbi:alpha/beta fold hydrolase [Ruicaihuangia caeni]|uniref:alpha/beta fold hydrolase n=1 Tax=Ruicaihuangia caeni TaxID=3042517 RepID=UPI00339075C7
MTDLGAAVALTIPGVKHRTLELPGLSMHVAEAGDGEPVVLLHGFFQHWWEWRHLIPPLAERYRVIAPDLRGAGMTDAPGEGYTREQLTADVVALLDALRLERVRLVAHDWSGLIGFLVCLQHPQRVRQYVPMSTGHPYIRMSGKALTGLWRTWFQLAIATPWLGPRLIGHGRQQFLRDLYRRSVVDSDAWTDADMEVFLAQLRDLRRARDGSKLYRDFLLPEFSRILRGAYRQQRLTTPTLMLNGEKDAGIQPSFLRGYESHADEMTIEQVPGVGHFIADEAPERVAARVLAFFAEC